jgi:transcription antitermination factor NusG
MAQRWYVLRSVSGDEVEIEHELRGAGFDAFVPMERRLERVYRQKRWRWEIAARPMLTGYVLVLFDIEEPGALTDVLQTNGAAHLLPKSGRREWRDPVPLPEGLAEGIREADIANSRVTLDDMLGMAKKRQERIRMAKETHVRVRGGAFAGYEGTVARDDGGEKLRIIIGSLTADIPAAQVEAA